MPPPLPPNPESKLQTADLVSFEHVEPEEYVHRLLLEDGEAGWEVALLDLHLHDVDATDDPLNADAPRPAVPAPVDQSLDAAPSRAGETHYRALRARVDERLHGVPVDSAVYVAVKIETERIMYEEWRGCIHYGYSVELSRHKHWQSISKTCENREKRKADFTQIRK